MIHAEPPVWDNIIMSFSKARKFQTKPFPLFQTLWELYEGHTTDGALNFTSTEPVPVTQPLPHEDVTQLISDSEVLEEDGHNSAPRVEERLPHEENDDDVRVLEPPPGPRCAGTT